MQKENIGVKWARCNITDNDMYVIEIFAFYFSENWFFSKLFSEFKGFLHHFILENIMSFENLTIFTGVIPFCK